MPIKLLKSQLPAKLILIGLFLFSPLFVFAQQESPAALDAFGGAEQRADTKEAIGVIGQSEKDPREIAANIINWLFGFLGLIAVSLIMYGGYIWMTSGGNPEKIQQAKDVLKNTTIGLVIILSAWAIVMFIFNAFFGGAGSGDNGGGGGGARGAGIGALGNGILESVYPEPNQTEVARNTGIIVTFREVIDAKSICASAAAANVCNGELITVDSSTEAPNVRIYPTVQGSYCEKDKFGVEEKAGCKAVQAQVYSKDGKTFVFRPQEYLGSPSEYIWHTVYLSDQLKKANGDNAFRTYDDVRDQSWSFEVSNKLDLEPPQVVFGATFPAADDFFDQAQVNSQPVAASTIIKVSAKPKISTPASVTSVTVVAGANATAQISEDCAVSQIKVTVDANKLVLASNASNEPLGQGSLSGDEKTATFGYCGLNLTLSGAFAVGNQWLVNIKPVVESSYLNINNIAYTPGTAENISARVFLAGNTTALTAASLVNVINGDGMAVVEATTTGSDVTVTAKIAGKDGNGIEVKTSDSATFVIANPTLFGGLDRIEQVDIRGRKDKPMNSAVQINFNEAVNPMTVAGKAADISGYLRVVNATTTITPKAANASCNNDNECLSLSCVSNKCVADYLNGNFVISNQYKTVEFISDRECGVNGCGEKIYCLPANSNIAVKIVAASLESCAADTDCASRAPYRSCSSATSTDFKSDIAVPKTCQDLSSSTNPINYPAASGSFDGAMDMAFNSMDGNRDTGANGKLSYYNENKQFGYCVGGSAINRTCLPENEESTCGLGVGCVGYLAKEATIKYGDNYVYSFWTSSEIKIEPPVIKNPVTPELRGSGVNLYNSVLVDFNTPMLSSSLSTGEKVIRIGQEDVTHKLMNLGAFTGAATGYWTKNNIKDDSPADGEIDWTQAEIAHSDLDPSTKYWAQAGSGIKDVYQNCFKPSKGPGNDAGGTCATNQTSMPSCCDGFASSSDGVINPCFKH